MKGLEAKTLGLRKVIRHEYKRIVAFMLTVAMVVTNFGTNLTVAFAAGEEESSLFLLNSSELEDAISAALESGDVFDFSSLELKAKQKSLKTSYEKLIGSKAGKVYQLDVESTAVMQQSIQICRYSTTQVPTMWYSCSSTRATWQ